MQSLPHDKAIHHVICQYEPQMNDWIIQINLASHNEGKQR